MALKSLFLPQNSKNHQAAGGSAPFVTRLSCNGLFSTGPKLDNFCAKNIYFWFKLLSLSKALVTLLVAVTPADRFSSDCTGRIRNELINAAGLIYIIFQRGIQNCSFKISVFKCISSVYFYSAPPPIFGLGPLTSFGLATAMLVVCGYLVRRVFIETRD